MEKKIKEFTVPKFWIQERFEINLVNLKTDQLLNTKLSIVILQQRTTVMDVDVNQIL